MERNNDLKLIKKHYNEKLSHLCRELFPTILERPGLLYESLTKNFEPSRFLYEDIVNNHMEEEFKSLIFKEIDVERGYKKVVLKTPAELLDEAGYILYECHTEEDIQQFKKYYAKNEELCTFGGDRLKRCYVFFAVKKNVDEIKREDFIKPERQDLYGTSVISIQFTKDSYNTVSIKNRYNHRVNNPDATFGNNLDNIIDGLAESFNKKYNLNSTGSTNELEIPNYVRANDGKYYRYYHEFGNIYYCSNNVIIDHFNVQKYDPARYIVFGYFILDLKKKKITTYNQSTGDESFIDSIGKIDKIEQVKDKATGNKTIVINKNIIITIDKYGRLIGYTNPNVKYLYDSFLRRDHTLEVLDLPEVEEIGADCLYNNECLTKVNLPKVKTIGDDFLFLNNSLEKIDLPNLVNVSEGFISTSRVIEDVQLPKVIKIGSYALRTGGKIERLDLPEVEKIGDNFMSNCQIKILNMPKVKEIGDWFLYLDNSLMVLDLPNVEKIGSCFLQSNCVIRLINIPKAKNVSPEFYDSMEELKREYGTIINLNKEERERFDYDEKSKSR